MHDVSFSGSTYFWYTSINWVSLACEQTHAGEHTRCSPDSSRFTADHSSPLAPETQKLAGSQARVSWDASSSQSIKRTLCNRKLLVPEKFLATVITRTLPKTRGKEDNADLL